MTILTPARLREMVEAAERATLGPWEWLNSDNVEPMTFSSENSSLIAACDPLTIIVLCRIALAAKAVYATVNGPMTLEMSNLEDTLREAGLV